MGLVALSVFLVLRERLILPRVEQNVRPVPLELLQMATVRLPVSTLSPDGSLPLPTVLFMALQASASALLGDFLPLLVHQLAPLVRQADSAELGQSDVFRVLLVRQTHLLASLHAKIVSKDGSLLRWRRRVASSVLWANSNSKSNRPVAIIAPRELSRIGADQESASAVILVSLHYRQE